MIQKILVRSVLLNIFKSAGLSSNPYDLHPLCHYIYYDRTKQWLKGIAGLIPLGSTECACKIIENTLFGYSTEMKKAIRSGDSFYPKDFIDEKILKKVEGLADEDTRNTLLGAATSYKFKCR